MGSSYEDQLSYENLIDKRLILKLGKDRTSLTFRPSEILTFPTNPCITVW